MSDVYIGNVPYSATEAEIKSLFEPFAPVEKVTIIVDHNTGKKTGYGFVKVLTQDIEPIIEALDQTQWEGRTIRVRHAQSK